MNIQQALRLVKLTESSKLDAEILLAWTLNKNRTYLKVWDDKELSKEQQEVYASYLKRYEQGEPVAYITGEQEFWSLVFKVTPDTLIPRPDTETLVEQALLLVDKYQVKTVLDLGTGTGAIALSLAHTAKDLVVVACDLSDKALDVAKENAMQLAATNVSFVQSNWFENITEKFDVLVSNPPYIEENDSHLKNLHYEPYTALVSGEEGLDDIVAIVSSARDYLAESGWILLEHGFNQAQAVQAVLDKNNFVEIQTVKDLAGQDRVTLARAS